MAEILGIVASSLTIVEVTFKSVTSLYEAVDSYNNHQRNVLQLKGELEALRAALRSLAELDDDNRPTIKPLVAPLRQCSKVCQDFEVLLRKRTARSGGSKASFRDWARLRYLGGDITAFASMLAGYKSIILITLADVNMLDKPTSRSVTLTIVLTITL
jgi:hypothetical protein